MEFIKSIKFDILILCLLFGSVWLNIWLGFAKYEATEKEIKRADELKQNEIQKKQSENEYKLKISSLECQLDTIKKNHSIIRTKIIYKYEKDSINFISITFDKQLDIWTRHTKN